MRSHLCFIGGRLIRFWLNQNDYGPFCFGLFDWIEMTSLSFFDSFRLNQKNFAGPFFIDLFDSFWFTVAFRFASKQKANQRISTRTAKCLLVLWFSIHLTILVFAFAFHLGKLSIRLPLNLVFLSFRATESKYPTPLENGLMRLV